MADTMSTTGTTQSAPRALVLDADLFFVMKIKETLRHGGYETRAVRSVAEFASRLRDEPPAVALVNTAARGIEWQQSIGAAREARVPVIAYGSHVDLETQQLARAAGATRVIANSKLASDLLGVVARTLRAAHQGASAEDAAESDAEGDAEGDAAPTGEPAADARS